MSNDQKRSRRNPPAKTEEAHSSQAVTPPSEQVSTEASTEMPTETSTPPATVQNEKPAVTEEPKVTALVVEDNEDYQVIFKNILQLAGYEVTVAVDGLEALKIFQEKKFFLAFLDLQMPGMDGLSVLRSIRQRPEYDSMYVLIITANAHMTGGSTSDLADFILLKPVNVIELAALAKRFKNVPRRPGAQGGRAVFDSIQGGSK